MIEAMTRLKDENRMLQDAVKVRDAALMEMTQTAHYLKEQDFYHPRTSYAGGDLTTPIDMALAMGTTGFNPMEAIKRKTKNLEASLRDKDSEIEYLHSQLSQQFMRR